MERDNKKVLETYEKKIIDLSRRNRLLKYPKTARAVDFTMSLEEFQTHFGQLEVLEIPFVHKDILAIEEKEAEDTLLIKKPKDMEPLGLAEDDIEEIRSWIPPTKPEGMKLITALTSLRVDSKRKFEEHGLHTLFVTIGKVQWKESQAGRGSSEVKENEFDYNAPLLLIPIIIEEKKNPKKTVVRLYDEFSDVTVNKVLSLLLEKEHGTRKLFLNEELLGDLPALVLDLEEQVNSIFEEIHIPVTVTHEIQIGQYTFYGQQIYEDIKTHEDIMLENEFLNALCSHSPIAQENLSIPIESSDNFLTVKNDFTVMDADRSQLEVIERVMSGNNLNVQGPPGTGKSQTIVNIIANLIARDKKVLLVCEKQVALEVVLNRLKDVGLDKLCLPLFKYNTDKKTFAKSIIDDRNSLTRLESSTHLEEELRMRESSIEELRDYAKALGTTVDPLEKSVFWVHGELTKYKKDVPYVVTWIGDDPLRITYEGYRNAKNILNEIDVLLPIIKDESHTHWKIVKKEQYSPDYFARVQKLLTEITSKIEALIQLESKIASFGNLSELQNYLQAMLDITIIATLPENIVPTATIDEVEKTLSQMIAHIEGFTKRKASFTKSFTIPSDWNSFKIEQFTNVVSDTMTLEQLHSITSMTEKVSVTLKNAKIALESMKVHKPLLDMSFNALLKQKELLAVDASITKIKQWDEKLTAEEISPSLQNLSLMYRKQLEIQKILNTWGVIEQTLDVKQARDICTRFIEKYNVITKLFSSQYKKDCLSIKSWCNAKSPTSFTDFKEITQALHDQLNHRDKLVLLLSHFNEQYLKSNETIDVKEIEQLTGDMTIISEYITTQAVEKLPEMYSSYIALNENHETKKVVYESLLEFEKLFESTVPLHSIFSTTGDESFSEFVDKVIITSGKITAISKLASSILKLFPDKKDYPTTVSALLSDAENINELVALRNKFDSLNVRSIITDTLSFDDYVEDIDALTETSDAVLSYKMAVKPITLQKDSPFTISDLQMLFEEEKLNRPVLESGLDEINTLCSALDSLLISDNSIKDEWSEISFKDLSKLLYDLHKDEEGLASWMQFNKYYRRMEELGFGWFIYYLMEYETVKSSAALFSVALWQAWLDVYYEKSPPLRNFAVRDHQRIIKEFKSFDNNARKINAMRSLQYMAGKIRDTKWKYTKSEIELVRQSQLKMRHKPVRKLVNDIGNQIVQYKPCWMMSPLTLSSYIPFGTLEFDVVIFDEASQMRVEHSLGSIARAKQVVIFGDENQLPPTSFFDVNDDTEEEDSDEDYESLLHATKEILPGADRLLSYHYRSKYEDLISYSNHYIYGNELISFPNPSNTVKPIDFVYLKDGIFDGGKEGTRKNFQEADKVAQLCIDHVKEFPKKTLGVIAFSKTQEVAIRDSVAKLLQNHPECIDLLNEDSDEIEKFFIKNLESVQGDERDVIILSIGYGKDKHGNMHQRFGPINTNHGFRRLNVAVTRAKEKIYCVTSMQATDITSEKSSRGVKLLQRYLEYAEYGTQTLQASKLVQNQKDIAADSPFEEEVEKALQDAGFIIHRQVGASGYKIDLAIVNPRNEKEYLLGIECDGATYHSSYSARMNDRIRQENLERLGWKLYRIWSQHWITHSGAIVDDIINIIGDS